MFSTLLILALFGYGIFILIQYIPQRIESATVNSILEQLYEQNAATPFSDMREVDAAVRKQLNINQMDDMRDNFKVTGNRGKFTVTVDYERELNLLYTIKTIQHHDELTL